MKKITVSILTTLLMLSMVFSSSVFAANEKVSAWDSFLGLFGVKATETSDVGVEYRGHVENKGDFPVDGTWIQGPDRLGTVGEGLRLEAFWIKLADDAPEGLHIEYQVHVQNKGWMGFVNDGARAGTAGEGLRIEAIEIALVDDEGEVAQGYSVEYRGHVQNIGDTEWYADGDQLGTTGSGLRLEALEIKIVQTKADMTAYEAALAAVEEADYTKASWAAYQAVVDANVVTEDNSQAEVDAATEAIVDAQGDLVTVPVIAGMTATAQKAITVTGTELNKLTTGMFAVAGNTVTSVVASADGTNAVIGLGTDLAPETNVKVTATIDGTSTDYTVKYTIAATTVSIADQTFDQILANQKVVVAVNGVETTADYLASQGYTVTFAAWNASGSSATGALFNSSSLGTIQVPQALEADFTAQVTLVKGSTAVTSAKANIKIRNLNNNISDITAYTLTNYAGGVDTFENASKTLVVGEQARITKVVVGYGTAAAELTNQVGYTVTSDNTAVASVNSAGVVTATGLGTANLTITAGKVTYTVPITIVGTARAATTVALKDAAAQFTAVIGNGVTNTMTVVVKDQFGDPFYSTGATTISVSTPANITGLTPLVTPIPSTSVKGEYNFTVTLDTATAVAGQSGNAVFRNNLNAVIGTAAIVTSNNNVATSTKLVVTDGPTNNTINNDLASQSAITFKVGTFNSANVQIGTVPDLLGYKVACDNTIIGITGATETATGYTLATGDNFIVTGTKAGTTTMLVQKPDGSVVESRTITVASGEVKITSVSFLAPATITNVGSVNYATVLALTEVATGKDPVVTGVTTTPTTVHSVRIALATQAGIIDAGDIYLDKNANGVFDGTDKILGTLTATLSQATGTSFWTTATPINVITGQATNLGNKGTITFNVTDTVSTTTPIVASKGVVVAVPGSQALAGVVNITGTPAVGQVLTADTTGITNNTGTLTVTWMRGATVLGTGTTYTVVQADAAQTITASVTSSIESGTVTDTQAIDATAINIAAIGGVTAPVTGAVPVTTATETAQYTATVTWSPSDDTFVTATDYTATITITPKAGYTVTGVAANFFTVTGATTVTNPADSGVVTAVFPTTL